MRSYAALTAASSVTSQPSRTSSETARAPCRRSSATVAAPMPRAPPVTTAVLSVTSNKSIRNCKSGPSPNSILGSMFDLVIRDALLLDGLGSAPARGDLAVKGDRIAAVGKVEGSAKTTLDAGGLALMPGIVDNHTHYDAQITWDPGVAPSPELGVTTAVIGNCGFTIAPCRSRDRELVMRNLTQVEGMSLEVLRQGIRWDFETVPQYLDMLERQGAALNVAGFAGHSAPRPHVVGEGGAPPPRPPAAGGALKALLPGG